MNLLFLLYLLEVRHLLPVHLHPMFKNKKTLKPSENASCINEYPITYFSPRKILLSHTF